jgi:hypothetical protein
MEGGLRCHNNKWKQIIDKRARKTDSGKGVQFDGEDRAADLL